MTKYTWNLSALLKGDKDPNEKKLNELVNKANEGFAKKWRKRSDYLTSPKALAEALRDYEVLAGKYGADGPQGHYWQLRSEQDEKSSVIKAKLNQVTELGLKNYNDTQFFILNLSKADPKIQKIFLSAKELQPYKHYLEETFQSGKYRLSESEEKILNLVSTTSYSNWIRMTSTFLAHEEATIKVDGKSKKCNLSELTSLAQHTHKSTRDLAAKHLHEIYARNKQVAENEMNSLLQFQKTLDELKGFDRPDHSRLISDDISPKTVDQMLKVVSDNFSIPQKYYALKAKLLKQKKLAYHERNVEITGKTKSKYPYEQSLELVINTFRQLDPEFAQITQDFAKQGRIDVFPAPGRTGGAFCSAYLKNYPIYILLNHTDRLNDVLTLAHELGHGINYELTKKHQHSLYYDSSLATAEVASTFMEDFVLDELLKKASEEEKFPLLMQKLNDDISTIFRQVACYQFEQELHAEFRKKGYLSAEEIGDIFQKHMAAYMGSSVEQSKGSENWWVAWSHIRRHFYVYSYASGLLISKAMQRKVRKNPEFIKEVKKFLSSGTSASPEMIFKELGIDITKSSFWKEGIKEIEVNLNLAIKLSQRK